jgi:hypothetical protein
MQNHCSLIYREEEHEIFPSLKVCQISVFIGMKLKSVIVRSSVSGLFLGLPSGVVSLLVPWMIKLSAGIQIRKSFLKWPCCEY